jgi:hypothetical protein
MRGDIRELNLGWRRDVERRKTVENAVLSDLGRVYELAGLARIF